MSGLREFKRKLATVSRLWAKHDYDAALEHVEALLKVWPGNAHLHVLWASLVQLQEEPKHELDEVREVLQRAAELEPQFPAAAVELGHFLDSVDDDPDAASKAYAEGIAAARRLLIDALLGQARVFKQLNKREEILRCLLEVLHLSWFDGGNKPSKGNPSAADILFGWPTALPAQKEPYASQIQDLVSELASH